MHPSPLRHGPEQHTAECRDCIISMSEHHRETCLYHDAVARIELARLAGIFCPTIGTSLQSIQLSLMGPHTTGQDSLR
jgi:hypothetical protein